MKSAQSCCRKQKQRVSNNKNMFLETGSFSASRRRFWSGSNRGFPANGCTQSRAPLMNTALSETLVPNGSI